VIRWQYQENSTMMLVSSRKRIRKDLKKKDKAEKGRKARAEKLQQKTKKERKTEKKGGH
jgi:hypothetical protein